MDGAMTKAGTFSDVIENIYDAGLQPELWNDVVVRIRDFVGGKACGLFSKDSISKFGLTHYYCGADPDYIRLYSETYCRFDPLSSLPPYGRVASIPDLVDYDEYRRGRFYQEWLKPQGCNDAANVVLDRSKSSRPILMTVLSGKRMVDEEMRRRISPIVPHANRALMINRTIESRQAEARAFAETLNGLAAGIFLLDAACQVVHANAAGHRMLESDDVLRLIGGQLVTRDGQVNKTLRELFGAGSHAATAAGDRSLSLTAHDGERYVAHVLPLASVTRNRTQTSGAERPSGAVAALFVRKAALSLRSCGELLSRTFDLTPGEIRVLFAVVELTGVSEVAQSLGVAETTVKTHLKRVFAKTGTSRQADLVKLAVGFANPLRGDEENLGS
jgi:DNA-binding CsgD family transcriptional regulator/PAS domain-containing protein